MHIYHLEMLNATFLFRKAVPVPLYEFLCFHHMWVPMFLHAFNLLFTFITLANQYLIHIMWYLSILICCPLNYWIRKTPYMLVNLLTSLFCWLSLHILHLYFYLFVFLSFHFFSLSFCIYCPSIGIVLTPLQSPFLHTSFHCHIY